MARTYHVLVVRSVHVPEEDRAQWGVEFGSWVRDEVAFERDEYRGKGVPASDLKIVACDGRQSSIDAAVAKLNAAR